MTTRRAVAVVSSFAVIALAFGGCDATDDPSEDGAEELTDDDVDGSPDADDDEPAAPSRPDHDDDHDDDESTEGGEGGGSGGDSDDDSGDDADADQDGCEADAHEPNDGVDTAWPLLAAAQLVGTACDTTELPDSDWYALGQWDGLTPILLTTIQAVGHAAPDVQMTLWCDHELVGYAAGGEKDTIPFDGKQNCSVGTDLWLEITTDAANPPLGTRYVLVRE